MISTIKALTRNRKMQYLPTCNRIPWQQIRGTLPVLQQGHKLEAAKHFQKINRICKDPELTGHDYLSVQSKVQDFQL
jgi:Mlc titration factor MtfA (ptsG expression regulator)